MVDTILKIDSAHNGFESLRENYNSRSLCYRSVAQCSPSGRNQVQMTSPNTRMVLPRTPRSTNHRRLLTTPSGIHGHHTHNITHTRHVSIGHNDHPVASSRAPHSPPQYPRSAFPLWLWARSRPGQPWLERRAYRVVEAE